VLYHGLIAAAGFAINFLRVLMGADLLSFTVHLDFRRTLNVLVLFTLAGGFRTGGSETGGFEGSDTGGFFSTGSWLSLAWRVNSCLMCSRNSLFNIVAGLTGGSGAGGFFFAGRSGLR
jgi:hypothetical protein